MALMIMKRRKILMHISLTILAVKTITASTTTATTQCVKSLTSLEFSTKTEQTNCGPN